jgi:hypothetical protein
VRTLVAALAVVLLVPAAAQAKGLSRVKVCGPDECRDAGVVPFGAEEPIDTSQSGLAPAPGPYYELRLSFEHGGQSQGIFYEPRSGLASYAEDFGTTVWASLAPPFAGAVKHAARNIEAFPAPRLSAVYVGDRRVAGDPSTYLALFEAKGPFVVPDARAGFEWIRFESTDANPWTQTPLAFYPQDGVLLTGPRYVKLEAGLAADIAHARPLGGGAGGGTTTPWIALGTAVTGLLILLLIGLRRTPSREVAPVH